MPSSLEGTSTYASGLSTTSPRATSHRDSQQADRDVTVGGICFVEERPRRPEDASRSHRPGHGSAADDPTALPGDEARGRAMVIGPEQEATT